MNDRISRIRRKIEDRNVQKNEVVSISKRRIIEMQEKDIRLWI